MNPLFCSKWWRAAMAGCVVAVLLAGCQQGVGAASDGGGGLADGEYDCSTASGGSWSHPGIMAMGHMDIRGTKYRYRYNPNDNPGWAGYTVAADQSITWNGRMGGLTTSPSVIVNSKKTSATSMNIHYRTKPGAFIEMMSCRLLK